MDRRLNPQHRSDIYCAVYEFAQGSCAETIWENKQLDVVNSTHFRLAVVNTPTISEPNTLIIQPTIICSYFECLQYIAIYILILDVEARGFTRPIVLLFACSSSSGIMETLMCLYRQDFLQLAKILQKKGNDIFPSELANYALELKDAINRFGDKFPILQSKFDELQTILPQAGITELTGSKTTERDPQSFVQINNQLRPIAQLIDFEFNKPKILSFIDSLPSTQFQASVMFGLGSSSINLMNLFDNDHSKDKFLLSTIQSSNDKKYLYKNLIFSLLSGRTLIIEISSLQLLEEVLLLANKLSILTQFDHHKLKIAKFPNLDSIDQCLQYDIVILQSQEESNYKTVSFHNLPIDVLKFDTEHCFYLGQLCPNESFVGQIDNFQNKFNNLQTIPNFENIFLITALNTIKHAYSRFLIKISEISTRSRQTRERMLSAFESIGFSSDDEPIFRNWTYCLASNSPEIKTIHFDA